MVGAQGKVVLHTWGRLSQQLSRSIVLKATRIKPCFHVFRLLVRHVCTRRDHISTCIFPVYICRIGFIQPTSQCLTNRDGLQRKSLVFGWGTARGVAMHTSRGRVDSLTHSTMVRRRRSFSRLRTAHKSLGRGICGGYISNSVGIPEWMNNYLRISKPPVLEMLYSVPGGMFSSQTVSFASDLPRYAVVRIGGTAFLWTTFPVFDVHFPLPPSLGFQLLVIYLRDSADMLQNSTRTLGFCLEHFQALPTLGSCPDSTPPSGRE